MSEKNVVIERVFDADRNSVWRAISDRELMKLWYFDIPEFRAEVGFKFEFVVGDPNGKSWSHLCEVTEVELETRLTYSWKYEGYGGISYVTFELLDENESTRLKLTHSGLETFPPEVPELDVHNFETGWNANINTVLKEYLEK